MPNWQIVMHVCTCRDLELVLSLDSKKKQNSQTSSDFKDGRRKRDSVVLRGWQYQVHRGQQSEDFTICLVIVEKEK